MKNRDLLLLMFAITVALSSVITAVFSAMTYIQASRSYAEIQKINANMPTCRTLRGWGGTNDLGGALTEIESKLSSIETNTDALPEIKSNTDDLSDIKKNTEKP